MPRKEDLWSSEREEDEDLWSSDSDSESGEEIRKGKNFSSQSKSWKLVACKEGQTSNTDITIFSDDLSKEEEKRIWPPYDSDDDDYEYLRATEKKRTEEFCQYLLKRADIKDFDFDKEAFIDMLGEQSAMPEILAVRLTDIAISYHRAYSDKISQHFKCIKKLLSLVPCITKETDLKSDYFIRRCIACGVVEKEVGNIRSYLEDIFRMEPFFHPLIRKNNIKDFVLLHKKCARIQRRDDIQVVKDAGGYFSLDAIRKIRPQQISPEDYGAAFNIVQLHQEFDRYVNSNPCVNEKSKISERMRDENVIPSIFRTLDDSLVKSSLRSRIRYLKKIGEFKRYFLWLKPFVLHKVKEGYSLLDGVLKAVREVHPDFPKLSQECILNEKPEELSTFCELLREIKSFTKCHVSLSYLVEGISLYMNICFDLEREENLRNPIGVFYRFDRFFESRCLYLMRIWGFRHYEHLAYTTYFDHI